LQKPPNLETTMLLDHPSDGPAAIRTHIAAIFVSLELSRSNWLITSLSPGKGEKMSKHGVTAGDVAGLMKLFADLRRKAEARTGESYPTVTIQEAGLDGFWLHRVLQQEGVESHVVDPASIAVPRRRRRAKTDRLDGETLLRALLAYQRGEPRVCAMVVAPSPDEEDRRRICRERTTLIAERITHVNRIKGLLFAQGISDYRPLRRDRRAQLEALRTGDGRQLPSQLKAQIGRELDRIELLLGQIAAVETERDGLLATRRKPASEQAAPEPVAMLLALRGVGDNFAAVLWSEAFYRQFSNRRQIAAYAGLAATPWQSGSIRHEQGVSKAGNPRVRTTMIQLAWLWIRHQPQSALTRWFKERSPQGRKRAIVALARKLLVALWKYVTQGVVIEGAVMKPAA
jgi:transposase